MHHLYQYKLIFICIKSAIISCPKIWNNFFSITIIIQKRKMSLWINFIIFCTIQLIQKQPKQNIEKTEVGIRPQTDCKWHTYTIMHFVYAKTLFNWYFKKMQCAHDKFHWMHLFILIKEKYLFFLNCFFNLALLHQKRIFFYKLYYLLIIIVTFHKRFFFLFFLLIIFFFLSL